MGRKKTLDNKRRDKTRAREVAEKHERWRSETPKSANDPTACDVGDRLRRGEKTRSRRGRPRAVSRPRQSAASFAASASAGRLRQRAASVDRPRQKAAPVRQRSGSVRRLLDRRLPEFTSPFVRLCE